MKLQAGEMYKMRNGEIVNDLTLYKNDTYPFYSKKRRAYFMKTGRMFSNVEYKWDIVERIPKENTMTNMESRLDNLKSEIERLNKIATKIENDLKSENEINVGDWFIGELSIRKCDNATNMGYIGDLYGKHYHKSSCKKITSPDHIKTLNEIYEANK